MNTVKLTSLDYAYEPGPTAPVPVFSGSIDQLSILGKMDMNSIGEIFVGKSSDIIFDNSAKILTERPHAAIGATETIETEDNYYFPVSEADKNIIEDHNYDALYLSAASTLGAGYTISAKIKSIEQSSASSIYYVYVEPADGRAFKTEIPTDTVALTDDEDITLLTEDTPVYKYIRPFRTTSFSITASDEALTYCTIRTRTSDRIIQAEEMDVVTDVIAQPHDSPADAEYASFLPSNKIPVTDEIANIIMANGYDSVCIYNKENIITTDFDNCFSDPNTYIAKINNYTDISDEYTFYSEKQDAQVLAKYLDVTILGTTEQPQFMFSSPSDYLYSYLYISTDTGVKLVTPKCSTIVPGYVFPIDETTREEIVAGNVELYLSTSPIFDNNTAVKIDGYTVSASADKDFIFDSDSIENWELSPSHYITVTSETFQPFNVYTARRQNYTTMTSFFLYKSVYGKTSMPVFTVPETEFHILFENNENIELRIISGRFTDIDLYGSAIQSFIGYNTPETAIALNTACFSLTDCPNIRTASISTSDMSPDLSANIKIKKLICPDAVYFNTNEFNYYN